MVNERAVNEPGEEDSMARGRLTKDQAAEVPSKKAPPKERRYPNHPMLSAYFTDDEIDELFAEKAERERKKAEKSAGALKPAPAPKAAPKPARPSGSRETPAPPGPVAPRPEPKAAVDQPLSEFARQVEGSARAVRRTVPHASFGGSKVFIAPIYEDMLKRGTTRLGRENFHKRLWEAAVAGLLRLSRADLVEAMDPKMVDASEMHVRSAAYHFVRI